MNETATFYDSITDVPGIKAGHWTDLDAATGCSVVLCEAGAMGGVDVRGGAPGTRETDLLRPGTLVPAVNAVLLTGGSAFGLDAAGGVMKWCEEHEVGLTYGGYTVPIVVGAVLFDLGVGRPDVRPDAASGYAACEAAADGPVAQGSVGAGTGATLGKALGMRLAVKGGIGTASEWTESGLVVGALFAVNALGEVVDSTNGRVVAGPRDPEGGFVDTSEVLRNVAPPPAPHNTTIGVIATNARLTKEQANRLATVAHDGLARAVRPAHTLADGDVVFTLATGRYEGIDPAGLRALDVMAARAVERAIVNAVRSATTVAGIPSIRDLEA
jgi:L-aminopeptidase/D-esterase-like protein